MKNMIKYDITGGKQFRDICLAYFEILRKEDMPKTGKILNEMNAGVKNLKKEFLKSKASLLQITQGKVMAMIKV